MQTKLLLMALPLALAGCLSKTPIIPQGAPANQLPQQIGFRVTGSLAQAGIQFGLSRKLEVGPAENGQTHRALLSESELAELQGAWNSFKGQAFKPSQSCLEWPEGSPWREASMRISLLQNEQEVLSLKSEGGTLCGPGDSKSLLQFAQTLLTLGRAYYPRTFPDACLAEQDEFSELADNLTSCTEDSQCTHVDPGYEEIPAGQIQYVSLKSCSAVPALPSANTEALRVAKRKLNRLAERILAACQPQGLPAACSSADVAGFQNDRHPARCIAGSCSSGLTVSN